MTEETFVRELEHLAEQAHGAPTSLEAVRGRAARIRRRRRLTAVTGAAALVAVAAVLPAVLPGAGPRPAQPASEPARAPGSSVLHDATVTLPDGRRVDLGADSVDVTELAVLGDGRVVLARQRPYAVQVHSPAGGLLVSYDVAANTLTASADGEHVAWVGPDLRVRILTAGVPEPAVLPGVPMPGEAVASIDAVLGPERYLGGDSTTTTEDVTLDAGAVPLRTSEPLRVTDVSPDGALWAVQYPDDADPQHGCAGIYDPEAGRMLARSCETALLSFAPDGRHLTGAKGDGGTWGSVEVLDLDLRPVGGHRPERGVVSSWGWADADHLVVAEAAGTRWRLLEVPVDGGPPRVLDGPVTGASPELGATYRVSR